MQCNWSLFACKRLILPGLSFSTLDVFLHNLRPGFKFIRPAADTGNDSQGLQDSGSLQLFSTYLGFFPFWGLLLPFHLSSHSFCLFLTVLFFITSPFLLSIHLCYIPLSQELWQIHLFLSVLQSGENVCIAHVEIDS